MLWHFCYQTLRERVCSKKTAPAEPAHSSNQHAAAASCRKRGEQERWVFRAGAALTNCAWAALRNLATADTSMAGASSESARVTGARGVGARVSSAAPRPPQLCAWRWCTPVRWFTPAACVWSGGLARRARLAAPRRHHQLCLGSGAGALGSVGHHRGQQQAEHACVLQVVGGG